MLPMLFQRWGRGERGLQRAEGWCWEGKSAKTSVGFWGKLQREGLPLRLTSFEDKEENADAERGVLMAVKESDINLVLRD